MTEVTDGTYDCGFCDKYVQVNDPTYGKSYKRPCSNCMLPRLEAASNTLIEALVGPKDYRELSHSMPTACPVCGGQTVETPCPNCGADIDHFLRHVHGDEAKINDEEAAPKPAEKEGYKSAHTVDIHIASIEEREAEEKKNAPVTTDDAPAEAS